jgi:lipopolysaccharide export system protein LptC
VEGNLYSAVVGWLKIILPVSALALLSTLFLFSRTPDPPGTIPYAEISAIADQAGISDPRFAGVTPDGSVVDVTARLVASDPTAPDLFRITDLAISLTDPAGAQVQVTAAEGTFNGRGRTAELTGLVRLDSSTGYSLETRGIRADLADGVLTTNGALEIRAPQGQLTAGALRITSDGGQRLMFTGGVRLLYDPPG